MPRIKKYIIQNALEMEALSRVEEYSIRIQWTRPFAAYFKWDGLSWNFDGHCLVSCKDCRFLYGCSLSKGEIEIIDLKVYLRQKKLERLRGKV